VEEKENGQQELAWDIFILRDPLYSQDKRHLGIDFEKVKKVPEFIFSNEDIQKMRTR